MNVRIGIGSDIHQLISGRRLIIGGVEIPSERGLLGHSDADVLMHALTDAVLGALAWGDIGSWFPNTDPRYAGTQSDFFLRAVWGKAHAEGWMLLNADAVIMAEQPRLQPYIEAMRSRLAEVFGVEPGQISIKAKTAEKLGFVGREEGIAAEAVVLLGKM